MYNRKEHDKKYYIKNREKLLEYQKKYREENPERIKECIKRWRKSNPEYMKQYQEKNHDILKAKKKEYDRRYYKKNRRKKIEIAKKWNEDNKKYRKEYMKNWWTNFYRENKEKILEYNKKYREKNRKEIKERSKQWRGNNPDKFRKILEKYNKTEKGKMARQRIKAKRRAKEKEITSTLTLKEWLKILKEYNYKCAYCGIEFNDKILPEKDHIIPISKGGDNNKENVVPACRSCNAKKNNKLLKEFVCPDLPK